MTKVAEPHRPSGDARTAGIRDYLMTLGSEAAVLVAGLLVFRLAAQSWDVVGFGVYVLGRRAVSLLQPPFLFGMTTSIARHLALVPASSTRRRGAITGAGVAVALMVTLVGVGILLVAPGTFSELLFGEAAGRGLLHAVALAVVGFVLHGLAYADFHGRLAMKAANALHLTNTGAVPLIVLLVPGLSPQEVIAWTGAAWTLVGGGALLWRLRRYRAAGPLGARTAIGTVGRYGLPRVPGDVAFMLLLALPVILAAHTGGAAAAGFVGLGVSLVRMTGGLFSPLGKVLLPHATMVQARGKSRALERLTLRLAGVSVAVSGAVVLVFLLAATPIIVAYLGPDYETAVPTVRIIVLGAVPFSLYVVLRNFLDATRVRALNTRNLFLALVPLGAGALAGFDTASIAWSTVVAFVVLGAATVLDTLRILKTPEPA